MIRITPGIRDTIVSFTSRVALSLLNLGLQSLLAWSLQPEGRGEYTVCLIFASLMAALLMIGADWAGTYYISSRKQVRNDYISATLSLFVIQSIICVPLMLALIQLPLEFFSKAPTSAFYVSIALTISLLGFTHTSAILRGMMDFPFSASIVIVKATLILSSAYCLYKCSALNVTLALACYAIGHYIYGICACWRIWTKWEFRPVFPTKKILKDLLHYGSRVYFGSLGMMANARIGTILVTFLMGTTDVGIFATAMALMGQLVTPADVINGITMPRVSASTDGRKVLIQVCCAGISTFILIAGTLIAITHQFWIPLLFSSAFLPAGKLLWILLPGFWLRGISKTLGAYFNGTNKPQYVSYSTIVNLATNIVLLWILLPEYGLVGGAWAASLSFVISSLFLIVLFSITTSSSPLRLFVPSYSALNEYWQIVIKKRQT